MKKPNLNYIVILLMTGGLIILAGFVHELGHGFACIIFGIPVVKIIYTFKRFTIIHGVSEIEIINTIIYFSGGFIASLVFMPLFWLIPKQTKYSNEVRVSVLVIVIYHFINAIIEGFFKNFYDKNLSILIPFFLLSIFLAIKLYIFTYHYNNKED